MILVKPATLPTQIWFVVDPWVIEKFNPEEGHAIALDGDSIDEIIVFLKSVRPKRIVVRTENEMLFRSLASAFTPDKVLRHY